VAEPITVIGLLMEVLEDDLYAVDLDRLSIVPGRNVSLRRSAARLSELGGNAYVLARGLFQMDTAGDCPAGPRPSWRRSARRRPPGVTPHCGYAASTPACATTTPTDSSSPAASAPCRAGTACPAS
jgi:hypothetical protein